MKEARNLISSLSKLPSPQREKFFVLPKCAPVKKCSTIANYNSRVAVTLKSTAF